MRADLGAATHRDQQASVDRTLPQGSPSRRSDMNILPKQPSVQGPGAWFTGVVHFDVIAPGDQALGKVNAVHFPPGARTAWHRHVNGQTLHVTEGIGLTQSRGGEVATLRPGDTVWC